MSRLNSTGISIHTCTELCCFPLRCFQKYKKPRKIVPSALPRLLLVLALLLDSELRVDEHSLSHVNSCTISLTYLDILSLSTLCPDNTVVEIPRFFVLKQRVLIVIRPRIQPFGKLLPFVGLSPS